MALLTVIIPMFNSARSIGKAIETAQRFNDVEIICVDDASQDDSVRAVERLFSSHPSLRLVRHTQNRGVGAARNTGISSSTSTWITFLDSDDEIDTTSDPLSVLAAAGVQNTDIVFFLHKVEHDDSIPFDYSLPEGILKRESIVRLAEAYLENPRGNSVVSHCWGKVYRSSFLRENSLAFREDLSIYEDTEFVARCMNAASSGYFSKSTLYWYNQGFGLSRNFFVEPLGFRHAIEQFAKFAGSAAAVSRANAIFLAKTLKLSLKLPLNARIDLYRRLAADAHCLETDASAVRDPILRFIIKKTWCRYARACSLLLELRR